MAVERKVEKPFSRESGQSLVEFLLLLPALVGMTVLMLRVNSVIQISLVNQQYARAHTLFLAMHSPNYPQLEPTRNELARDEANQMLLGVSSNVPDGTAFYNPEAMVMNIARKKNGGGSDGAQEEPEERTRIRVRTTVTLCTQPLVVQKDGQNVPIMDPGGGGFNLTEGAHFDFCRSKIEYE